MTPWFNKYTRPHWIGVYETRIDKYDELIRLFNYWNGSFWEGVTSKPMRCGIQNISQIQHIEWRGFTKEQK
jgi:hypothetical protein